MSLFRNPKFLFGAGALGLFGLLALTSTSDPFLFIPGPPPPAMPFAGTLPVPSALPTKTTGLTSYLSSAFFVKTEALAAYFRSRGAQTQAEELLAVFLAESGIKPSQPNSIGCAGLNQICSLKNVGWTGSLQDYLALPGEAQLDYVKRYFDNVNRYAGIRDYGSLYLANFSPAFLGRPDNFIMYRQGIDKSYALNQGVDFGHKGYIEVADMAKFVKAATVNQPAKWAELLMRLAAVRQSGNV